MLNEAGNALEDVQLVDVREEEEQSIASLPGFQLMPLSRYHQTDSCWQFTALISSVLHVLQASRVLGRYFVRSISPLIISGSCTPA